MHIEVADIAMEVSCLLFLLTLFAALLFKREWNTPLYLIGLIFGVEILALTTDLIYRVFGSDRPIAGILYFDYVVSFFASVLLVCSFTWYFYARFEERGMLRVPVWVRWLVLVYAGVVLALFLSSIWNGWFFYIDLDGKLAHTDNFSWMNYLFFPLVIYDIFIILYHRKVLGFADTAVMILYCVLPVVALIIDMRIGTVFAHLALTLDACMLYTFVDADQERKLARSRRELAEMNLNSMVAQINPHFLYNTLSSIESLMVDRPEKAQKLLSDFSEYLGDNYLNLTRDPLIPFDQELKHVEHYLAIEQVRFPNLKVEYDIEAIDFQLPALSVQPLVENAVKHGICRKRRSAGTLQIASSETEDAFVVVVEDDGVGFVPDIRVVRQRPHVGIDNVTKRLELLCDGSLTIVSKPGLGTTCTMMIPKGGDTK